MPNAIALNWLQMNASRVVWPTMAGGLIAFTGADWALMLSAVGFLVGVVFLLPIHERVEPRLGAQASPIADIVEAVQYSFATPLIRMVLSLAVVVGMFGLAFQNLAPAFAREVLKLDAGATGVYLMAIGIGSIIGSSAILFLEVNNRHLLFASLAASFALSLIALALAPWTAVSFILVGVFGVFNAPLPVTAQTILQTLVPPRLIGRVLSVLMLAPALGTVATLPMGLVADVIGLRATVGGCAVALLIAVLSISGSQLPRINRILAEQRISETTVGSSPAGKHA
jgi:predicted MFS family arabinose efflux permease